MIVRMNILLYPEIISGNLPQFAATTSSHLDTNDDFQKMKMYAYSNSQKTD